MPAAGLAGGPGTPGSAKGQVRPTAAQLTPTRELPRRSTRRTGSIRATRLPGRVDPGLHQPGLAARTARRQQLEVVFLGLGAPVKPEQIGQPGPVGHRAVVGPESSLVRALQAGKPRGRRVARHGPGGQPRQQETQAPDRGDLAKPLDQGFGIQEPGRSGGMAQGGEHSLCHETLRPTTRLSEMPAHSRRDGDHPWSGRGQPSRRPSRPQGRATAEGHPSSFRRRFRLTNKLRQPDPSGSERPATPGRPGGHRGTGGSAWESNPPAACFQTAHRF